MYNILFIYLFLKREILLIENTNAFPMNTETKVLKTLEDSTIS